MKRELLPPLSDEDIRRVTAHPVPRDPEDRLMRRRALRPALAQAVLHNAVQASQGGHVFQIYRTLLNTGEV